MSSDARSEHVLALSHVLERFLLSEEQIWSLAHQSLKMFKEFFEKNVSLIINEEKHLFITSEGRVHPKSLSCESHIREIARSQQKLLNAFGFLLFRALDFGLNEDEERTISRPLEALIESLTSNSEDEGFCDVIHDFDDVIEKCVARIGCREEAEMHYKAVLRALVLESLELKMFLERIREKEKPSNEEDNCLLVQNWAKHWIHVIKQLRDGVKLKHVSEETRGTRGEYALTPYEMLLTDIKTKKYKLNHVTLEEGPEAKKDAHALILEFIRSRPCLAPVAKRRLNPLPFKEKNAFERLMESIRENDVKLKPIDRPIEKWSSQHNLDDGKPETVDRKSITQSLKPQRRLIKANLNLQLDDTFDDSDDTSDDDIDDRREEQEVKPNQPKTRKFSLRNLTLNLNKRHSSDETTTLDVNEDTREHVAQIWEASEWGRALECLSLTLQEVKHFRSVLTKAEMESLGVTKELRDDLVKSKICFTCLKTRFTFFGARPNTCKVCERAICDRCASRMHIPCEHFEKVPIYMLSPTPSPPEGVSWERRTNKSLTSESKSRAGPLVRVCRDCKRLVRHLIDTGSVSIK